MIDLSPRLKMAADNVRIGSSVVDIGTDHAFLPAYLILNNKTNKALACDLREGPLFNAEKTAVKYNIQDKLSLRLSDGLDSVLPDEADDIFICGMGGTLIFNILNRTNWIKNKKYRLILQPQSHSEEVRQFLFDNCFDIINEDVCKEGTRIYNLIVAEYSGTKRNYSDYDLYFGKLDCIQNEIVNELVNKDLYHLNIKMESEYKFGSKDKADRLKKIIDKAEEIFNVNN